MNGYTANTRKTINIAARTFSARLAAISSGVISTPVGSGLSACTSSGIFANSFESENRFLGVLCNRVLLELKRQRKIRLLYLQCRYKKQNLKTCYSFLHVCHKHTKLQSIELYLRLSLSHTSKIIQKSYLVT